MGGWGGRRKRRGSGADAPLIDQSQTGCQSPQAWDTADEQQLSVSAKVSALPLLIGNNLTLAAVIKMPIYKRLSRRWPSPRDARPYGFVGADQTDAVGTRRERGIRPGPLSLPGSFHLRAHWRIKQLHATLKDGRGKKKQEKERETGPRQHQQMLAKRR